MNKLRKNIILVLIVSLILSVNYAAFAESSESKDLALNMDELTEEKTTETIATNDATEQDEKKDESEEEVITVDEPTEKDQDDESEAIDESETEEDAEEIEVSNDNKKQENDKTDKQENNEDEHNDFEEDESLDLHEEKTAKEKDKTEAETDKLKSESVEVSDWEEFKTAYDNQNVREIILESDIIITDSVNPNRIGLAKRSESITIDGRGKTLDTQSGPSYRSALFNLENNGHFILKDINIIHSEEVIFYANIVNSKWTLDIQNVSNQSSEKKSSMAFGSGIIEVLISGDFNWDSAGHLFQVSQANIVFADSVTKISSVQTTFKSKSLAFKNTNANLTKENYNVATATQIAHVEDSVDGSFITFEDSTVEVNNNNEVGTTFKVGKTHKFDNNVKFTVDGSDLTVNDNTKSGSSGDAIISLVGNSNDNKSGLFIKNESTVNLNSNGGRALGMQISGGGLIEITDPGTHVTFSNRKESTRNEPLIETFQYGGHKLTVSDEAKVNLLSEKKGSAEVIRMSGSNNHIDVNSKGKLYIENAGENLAQNPGSVNKKQGIVFWKPISQRPLDDNVISVNDSKSVLSIKANAGAAIDSITTAHESDPGLKVEAQANSNLIISGNTPWKSSPIINSKRLDVKLENADYYDIMNTRDGGGILFYGSNSAKYISDEVELEVWEHGSNTQDIPTEHISGFNFSLYGKHLQNVHRVEGGDPNEFQESFADDGMKAYTRIRGNNVRKIDSVKLLEKPYDTDRYIYGKASIKLGSTGESRPALPDEVLASVSEYNTDNKPIETYTKLPTQDGYPVYDTKEDKLAGHFRVDLGEGNLATAGHSFEIKEIYLNEELVNEQAASKVTVIDKTPPKPAEIKPVYAKDQVIKGSSDEHHISAHFEVNGQVVKNESGETVVVNDTQGDWEVTLPKQIELQVDDVVTVFLQDANKNKNPVEDTSFHDAHFEKASSIVVIEKEKKPQIKGENLFITRHEFIEKIKEIDDLVEQMQIVGVDLNHDDIAYDIGKTVVENLEDKTPLNFKNPKVGMYDVTAQLKDYPEIKTVKRLYISQYDHVSEGQGFVIEANDFSIPDYIAAAITKEEVIDRSKAKAWEIKNMHTEDEKIKEHDVAMSTFNVKGVPDVYQETLVLVKK